MAELNIKVTTEEVRSKAQEITTQKSMMEAYMQDMASKVSQLGNYWKAASGETYIEKYQNVTSNIQKSLDVLEQHVTNLQQAADRYDELENAQSQAVNALDATNIF